MAHNAFLLVCLRELDDTIGRDKLPNRLHCRVVETRLAQLFKPGQLDASTLCMQLRIVCMLPGQFGTKLRLLEAFEGM